MDKKKIAFLFGQGFILTIMFLFVFHVTEFDKTLEIVFDEIPTIPSLLILEPALENLPPSLSNTDDFESIIASIQKPESVASFTDHVTFTVRNSDGFMLDQFETK